MMARQAAPLRPLPYGPRLTRWRAPLRRVFLVVNRWLAPALDHGLGALMSTPATGYLFVLRTRGRRSGLWREAPLGYVIIDGDLYCAAGWGADTAWLRNIEADPAVEVVLPGRTLRGQAFRVVDGSDWTRAYRQLIASFGVVGRLTVGGISQLDDETLLAEHGGIPIVRVHPSGLEPGALDPGGGFWRVPIAALALAVAWAIARRRSGTAAERRPAD